MNETREDAMNIGALGRHKLRHNGGLGWKEGKVDWIACKLGETGQIEDARRELAAATSDLVKSNHHHKIVRPATEVKYKESLFKLKPAFDELVFGVRRPLRSLRGLLQIRVDDPGRGWSSIQL